MYKRLTGYADEFKALAQDEAALAEKAAAFARDVKLHGIEDPGAMERMMEKGWITNSSLLEAAPAMTAEEVLTCLAAFVAQEEFIPGILANLVQLGVLPRILERLAELDDGGETDGGEL